MEWTKIWGIVDPGTGEGEDITAIKPRSMALTERQGELQSHNSVPSEGQQLSWQISPWQGSANEKTIRGKRTTQTAWAPNNL